MLRKLAHFALFGNYYLAFCIVALSVETGYKNGFYITHPLYYFFVFLSVLVYYTHAYIGEGESLYAFNERSRWYAQNKKLILVTQTLYTFLIAVSGIALLYQFRNSFILFNATDWLLMVLFPLVALLYYGVIFPAQFRYKLRNIAWLKPFIIGFVCTGIIVIYPMLFHVLEVQESLHLSTAVVHYFFTNWLFTCAIAIMFDIKDFAADHNYHLKTFVVAKGLRHTIFFILLPIAVASYVSFIFFAVLQHFSFFQIFINTIPFLLLLLAATSLRRRKGILYYLVVIDGLLILKALFGIGAMLIG